MAKGTGLAVIALLLGVSGLGVGGYSFYQLQTIETLQGEQGEQGEQGLPGRNGTDLIAVWDYLEGGPADNFNLSLFENTYSRPGFYSLSANNESLQFTQEGWYKISIRILFGGIANTDRYKIQILKNGEEADFLLFFEDCPGVYYQDCVQGFFYSDGDDILTLNCYSDNLDVFNVYTAEKWNQVAIEYIYNT